MEKFKKAIVKAKSILQLFPNVSKSNVEFYIAVIESELRHDLSPRLKEIIRAYPPETMCRMRRKLTRPTETQDQRQEDFRELARDKTI